MTQHSPGPWSVVDDHNGTRIEDANGYNFLSVTYAGDYSGTATATIHNDADARLIAAAPDLYDALWCLLTGPATPKSLRRARLALEKAKGE